MKNAFIVIILFLLAFSDVSAQKIKTVRIGRQVWTLKNLDVITFQNGDTIPQAKTEREWDLAGKNMEAAWCYYKFDESNNERFGKLYNWYAINDSREMTPLGFHVPSSEEWDLLCEHLKGNGGCGYCLKTTQGWESYSQHSGNGSNYSGFSALPGGIRNCCEFRGLGSYCEWWTVTPDRKYILTKTLNGRYDFGNPTHNILGQNSAGKEEGHYVRCIKDPK